MNTYLSVYLREKQPGILMHWCPGCGEPHTLNVDSSRKDQAVYLWNGNPDNPSFQPAVLLEEGETVCNYTIKNCYIQYSHKCTHKLRGKLVLLPFYPGV